MALLKVILISRVYLYQFSASEGTLQGRFPEAKIHRKDAMAQRRTAFTEHNYRAQLPFESERKYFRAW
ncbi:hypothetical protein AEM51_02975 [Bacteroidetes bacterium UKL13-3]|nr:hypothetical protein AEM51_02975 [Bacteroidetes bacterium UKL13-3]